MVLSGRCRRSPLPVCYTGDAASPSAISLTDMPPCHAAPQPRSPAMPRRKAAAPQRDQGRFEDRFLVGDGDAGEDEATAQLWDPWQAGGSQEESEEDTRRPAKRRRKLHKRGRGAAAAAAAQDDAGLSVVVAAEAPGEQRWRFAELPVVWWEAAGPPRQQREAEVLEEGQLLFTLEQPQLDSDCTAGGSASCSISVQCQSSGAWQGSAAAAADAAAAEALLLLLRSGHLSCSLTGQPGASRGGSGGALALSLTDKAAGDIAEHPEEQQQRLWHRQLLAVMRWLLPHLDPEEELDQQQAQQAQQGSAADRSAELLSSPLCSPRKGADPPAATWPGSPRSPLAGSAAAAAAAAFDAAELYAAVKPSGREPELPAGATSATLLPTLRRYQARAALWMVQRERGGSAAAAAPAAVAASGAAAAAAAAVGLDSSGGSSVKQEQPEQQQQQQLESGVPPPLHPLWREVPCGNGSDGSGSTGSSCFFFNPYNGRVAFERFAAEPEVGLGPGGCCDVCMLRSCCFECLAHGGVGSAACSQLSACHAAGTWRHSLRRNGAGQNSGAAGMHHCAPLHRAAAGVCGPPCTQVSGRKSSCVCSEVQAQRLLNAAGWVGF